MLTMATANPPQSKFPPERVNYIRLSNLLIDIGRKVLKDKFDAIHPSPNLHAILFSSPVQSILNSLRFKRVLNTKQWSILFPRSGMVSSGSFDVTLLFLLLRNICGLSAPATGWDAAPLSTDLSFEADLIRTKRCRNDLAHHPEQVLTDSEFDTNWIEMEAVLTRLGGRSYLPEIQRLKSEPIDSENERNFEILLLAWEEGERNILDAIQRVSRGLHNLQSQLEKMSVKAPAANDIIACDVRPVTAAGYNDGKLQKKLQKSMITNELYGQNDRASRPSKARQHTEQLEEQDINKRPFPNAKKLGRTSISSKLSLKSGAMWKSGLSKHAWRETEGWGESARKSLKKEVMEVKPPENVPHLNIILIGESGAGKSSLYNSIHSALESKIIQAVAPAGSKEKALTFKVQVHHIIEGWPVRIINTKGLEAVDAEDLKKETDYLLKGIQGHLKDGHEYKKDIDFDYKDEFFRKEPSIDMRAHCVAFVVNAHTWKHMKEEVFQALKNLHDKIHKEEFPVFILLTHIDEMMPGGREDVSKVYRRTKVHKLVQTVSNRMLGIPEGQIFPIINYRREVERSAITCDMDVLLLTALRQMLYAANGHVEDRIRKRGNSPVELLF